MSEPHRVVVALPDRLEGAAVADWLSTEGFDPFLRTNMRAAADDMRVRAFDVLIADAAFVFREGLRPGARARSPRVPPIVIGGAADEPRADAVTPQAMYLTRPLDRATLLCFVTMALLDGRPSRRSLRKPVDRFDAFVNGMPVRLLDVSNEGLRLETPPGRSSPLPPCFNVRVPFVGVSVTVQRMWSGPSKAGAPVTWYGAALSGNRPPAEHGWRSFVDAVPVVR